MMVNRNLMGRHHMQVVSKIDQVAIQTDGKYIQTQKQRKDRSDFSDHVWILNYESPPASTKAVDQCRQPTAINRTETGLSNKCPFKGQL